MVIVPQGCLPTNIWASKTVNKKILISYMTCSVWLLCCFILPDNKSTYPGLRAHSKRTTKGHKAFQSQYGFIKLKDLICVVNTLHTLRMLYRLYSCTAVLSLYIALLSCYLSTLILVQFTGPNFIFTLFLFMLENCTDLRSKVVNSDEKREDSCLWAPAPADLQKQKNRQKSLLGKLLGNIT